jgi:AcrR family transcriptional regulator
MVEELPHRSPEEGKARILRAALQRYLRGQRIELVRLAAEQGVSRATAYRWWGSNDRLLAEVCTRRVTENFFRLLRDNVHRAGREKVLCVVDGFLRHAVESRRLAALLKHDQRRTLKVIATSVYGVQQTVVALFGDLLAAEQVAGNIALVVPARTLALGIVRLIEASLYADLVTGEKRDVEAAVQLIGLLIPSQPADDEPLVSQPER